MTILYIGNGDRKSTCYHRYEALKRIGHNVIMIDINFIFDNEIKNKYFKKIHFHTGYIFFQRKIKKIIIKKLSAIENFDFVWISGGEMLGAECLKIIKQRGKPIILYNNDDPTGFRDGNRFYSLRKSFFLYDLCVIRMEKNEKEYLNYGVKNILKVRMSYDEINHKSSDDITDRSEKKYYDIVFVGTFIKNEDRDKFILELSYSGLSVSIWGDRWQKSKYWDELKVIHKGDILSGEEYIDVIQGAKISLGLVSKGNRDQHTRRSVEIPYMGGLLCAKRTFEHLAMYNEGEEAVFWENSGECIAICKKILADDILREKIRLAGMKRVRENKVGNEDICKQIIEEIQNKLL